MSKNKRQLISHKFPIWRCTKKYEKTSSVKYQKLNRNRSITCLPVYVCQHWVGKEEKKRERYREKIKRKRGRGRGSLLVYLYILLLWEGVGRDVAWGGVLKDRALALMLGTGLLGQEGEWGVDGGRMLIQIVFFVTCQTIAHIVSCVWKIVKEFSRTLHKKSSKRKYLIVHQAYSVSSFMLKL